ncbi:MAG: hypothetical protein ICV60_23460 [Pyrinomonadaceae bacterium]|nr:hypothetical protein [Pyrinomonadaceae bacterium]
MLTYIKQALGTMLFIIALAINLQAQSPTDAQTAREPSAPARPFGVLQAQSLSDLERKLRSDNKVEELIGGSGMQLRVAVQSDRIP